MAKVSVTITMGENNICSTKVTGAPALAGAGKCNAVDLTQILDQQKTSFICTIENILFLIKYALS